MQNRIEPKKIHYSLAKKSVEEYCKYNQLSEEQKFCLKNCIIEQIKDFDLKARI